MGGARRATQHRSGQRRLFKRSDLRLRRTGEARLRDMVRVPVRPRSERMARAEEDHAAMERLRRWADELVTKFRLRYVSIESEGERVT